MSSPKQHDTAPDHPLIPFDDEHADEVYEMWREAQWVLEEQEQQDKSGNAEDRHER